MSRTPPPKRARLPRKAAAAAVSYVDADPADDSDPDDLLASPGLATLGTAAGPRSNKKGKAKSKAPAAGAYLWKAVPDGLFCNKDAKEATFTVKRVDFSALLPTEIVLEICAHLLPPSLHALARVNKRLYTTLTSETGSAMWRRKLEAPDEIPNWIQKIFNYRRLNAVMDSEDSDDSEVASSSNTCANKAAERRKRAAEARKLPRLQHKPLSPFKIASLYHYTDCQICGSGSSAPIDPSLLIRCCQSCIDTQGVPLWKLSSDENLDDDLDDLHRSVSDIVRTTYRTPSGLKPRDRRGPYALLCDLRKDSEVLEGLQMEDDASRASAPSASASVLESRRESGRRSSRTSQTKSTRVEAYVERRKQQKEERAQIGQWLRSYGGSPHETEEERREGALFDLDCVDARLAEMTKRITEEGLVKADFLKRIPDFSFHPFVKSSEPLTAESWTEIAPRIYKDLARCIAHNIMVENGVHAVTDPDFDWDKVMHTLLAQPKKLRNEMWAYVRPELVKAIECQKKHAVSYQSRLAEQAVINKELEVVRRKQAFFRSRLTKIRDGQRDDEDRSLLPTLSDFIELPTVCRLYDDKDYAIRPSEEEADLAVWGEHLPAILDEIDDWKVHVRLETLRMTLAATTDLTEAEVDAIDADTLNEPTFDESFFQRPTSWVNCSTCTVYGSLDDVLKHRHASLCLLNRLRSPKGAVATRDTEPAPAFPVDLSLEVACTILSVCELGGVSADAPYTSTGAFRSCLGRDKMAWKNRPTGLTTKMDWMSLISLVCLEARKAHANDELLAVPDIVTKGISNRELIRRAQ